MLVQGLNNNPHFPQFGNFSEGKSLLGWNLGEEAFQKASLRVLFVFPSGMGVRSVSATHTCLYNIVKNHYGDDVFVDIWMKPYPWDASYMAKNYPQNIIGFFSHHTYDDFDIVGLSLAITSYEFVEVANVFRDTGIPLWSEDRLNDDKQPLIVGGGIAQDNTVILDRVQDLVMLGLGERNLIRLCDIAFQVQAECGSVKKGKTTIISRAQMLTGFYNPKNYHYSWNVVNGHVECKYESCDVPELQRIKADIALPAEVIASGTNNVLKLSTPGGHHKVSLQSAFACHGLQGSCFFCHEAWLYGAWRESPPEALKKGIYESKKSSMGEGFGYFAFNANFNTNYVDSLQWAAEYFNKIGTINIRQDSLAGSIKLGGENNYIRLLKELGTTSIAAPIEGISQRLRNWLNKNLTVDDILTVSEEVFKRRMIRFKNGIIVTCYETKEDYEEHRELIIKQQELRDKWGANTQQQVNGTYLVHNYATPLYYLPRKSTALAWKQFFSKVDGKDFYFYPWMYMSDLGVKYKESSQPTDTIVQQTLQDLPCELLEEFYLKPVYDRRFENMSKEMVINLRKGFEKYGINPKAQFLEYDAYKHPRQHMDIGQAEVLIKRYGSYEKLLEYTNAHDGTGCCLKTPGTEWKQGTLMNCKGCNYCPDIDKIRKEMGLEVKEPHMKWMHNRPLNTAYNIMDVKTSILKNTPSFYYRLIFKVTEPGRFVAKEALVRRWLSKATDYDDSLVKNFRTISTALHKWLDYEGITSTYAGYELCIMGFQNQLNLESFKEIAKKVNEQSLGAGIALVDIQTAQESGGTSFYVLHSFEVVAEREDFDKFIDKMCNEPRRLYEGSCSQPETFAMPIDYKILRGKKGYRVLLLCPPRFNITHGEGCKKWTAPRVFDHIVDWNIMAIFTKTQDGRYIDVLTGKPFEVAGFVHAEQTGEGFADKGEEAPEMDGA